MDQKETCPICAQGILDQHLGVEDINYRETSLKVPLAYSVCPVCESETITTDQIRTNDLAIRAEYKRVQGLLPGANVRAIRNRLGLTQKAAAQLFGGGVNAFTKYESESVVQSKALDLLLRLASEDTKVVAVLQRIYDYPLTVESKSLQGGGTLIRVNSGENWTAHLSAISEANVIGSSSNQEAIKIGSWGQCVRIFNDSDSVFELSNNLQTHTNAHMYKAA